MRLGFSKLLENTCGKICICLLKGTLKKDQQRTYQMVFMPFFSEIFSEIDAIQMGTHSICLYKEVAKQYTSCNPKSTELLDCAPIGVCAVIRSNTVFLHGNIL